MGLIDDIGSGPVALDTATFIYFMEDHPRYAPLVAPVFAAVDSGRLQAVTSALTLLEVLVVPYRLGHLALAERYEALLTRSRGLELCAVGLTVLRTAAQLRATHSALRAPDALQVATGLIAQCTSFVTNDARVPVVAGLAVRNLDAYL